ncbi:sialic acid-binding Ig-like lectin 12 [Colossoma macropomum]|uniref:sialic acid-binding Ig-like lectin 12 n=1 Tax=Colossoma macropomum TaxID=42526 RepID=UPI00186528AF|nr:sialic acid-binding Ig-like lectin 12 [Colossoma macropomum]
MSTRSGNITAAVILILLTGVQAQHSVTLSSQSLCAVTGSAVKISCKYTTANSSRVREREWYQLQSSDGEERVLSKDPQYSARVSVRTEQNDCDLTVWDVRLRDSGVYNFRFRTSSSDWISASSGVNLTVTELQVDVDRETAGQRKVKLTCSSTCSFGNNLFYYWFRNGQYTASHEASVVLDSTHSSDEGSYSCRVSDSWHRSPAVCISANSNQKSCWSVTYSPKAICALIGSSVDIRSYYTFPDNQVTKSVWFIKEQAGAEPVDVREDEEYQGRVQYGQSFQNDCSMRITHLRERDAQTYRFRFYTDGGEYTGEPGVTLSVTDLKVTVSDTDSGGKKLSCNSTCTLPNYHTYIWYKNGQPVSDQSLNSTGLYLYVSAVGADRYSCAVAYEKLRSPAVYSPRNTSVVIIPSGEKVEGDSVTLSCISDANPPVLIYSWFNQRAAADAPLTTGQNYTITNISSQHSGLYYCTAHNQLGQQSSTPTRLNVLLADYTAVKYAAFGVTVVLLLIFITICLCMRRRAAASSSRSEEDSRNVTFTEYASVPVYDQVSDLAMTSDPTKTAASDDRDEVQYSSIQFTRSHAQEVPLYSTVHRSGALKQEEEVEYSTVKLSKPRAVQ